MLLGCGLASWKLLCPILIPVLHLLRSLINSVLENKESFPFFFTLIMFLGEFLGGAVFECVSLILNRTFNLTEYTKGKPILTKRPIISIIGRTKTKLSYFAYILVLLITLLDALFITSEAFLEAVENGNPINTISKVFTLITTCILSKYAIQTPFFKHHLYSLIIIVIGFMIGIVYLFNPISEVNYFFAYFSVCLVNTLIISFYFIAQKFLMEREMIPPFRIILFQGVIGSLLSFSFMALMNISCKTKGGWCEFAFNIENVFAVFERFFNKWQNALLMFASIVCSGLVNICYITTALMYTPAHESVCQCFCYIFTIAPLVKKENLTTIACFVVGDILLIIGSVFYFEFIILNWRGFSENTQKEIRKRCIHDKHRFFNDMREMNEVDLE